MAVKVEQGKGFTAEWEKAA